MASVRNNLAVKSQIIIVHQQSKRIFKRKERNETKAEKSKQIRIQRRAELLRNFPEINTNRD